MTTENSNISLIVAVDENWGIGKGNQLLCPISEDLKRFKMLTTGKTIVMGRKTFESLPHGALPNRRNIVLTKNKQIHYAGCDIMHSVSQVMDATKGDEEVFIIGGAEIYTLFMERAEKIYLTQIHQQFDADTFIVPLNWEDWFVEECVDNELYSFINLVRKPLLKS